MARKKRPIGERVVRAAEETLAAQKYVRPIDVLLGMGWLDPNSLKRWQQGQVPCLERVIQANLSRISDAMKAFRCWASDKGLRPSETAYAARTPGRPALRFSVSGNPTIERLYRTHWVSPELSERKRERLAEKASRAPELVVIDPLHDDWKCHRCGGRSAWLIMENGGPACLGCVGLGDLVWLPAGDMLLTRRAKAKSARHAVVVRFGRTRKRYERKGLLVEPQALEDAQREVETERAEKPKRNRQARAAAGPPR